MRPEDRVLSEIARTSDPWEVAGRARVPFACLVELLRSFEQRGLVRLTPGRVELTPAGQAAARPLPDPSGPPLAGLRERYARLLGGRPEAIAPYDQGHLTVDSVVGRVREMAAFGDLVAGCRVLVLGDDDLISLALALTGLPARVTVLEIDERIGAFIRRHARRLGAPVEVHAFDVRQPLPPAHLGAYDLFVCDPTESESGLRAFLSRGLEGLRPGPGAAGWFGLTLIEASYAKWRQVQHWLTGLPVVISAILPDHGRYENWPGQDEEAKAWGLAAFTRPAERPWYRSALYRVETLDGFQPRAGGTIPDEIVGDHQHFARDKRKEEGGENDRAWT